MNCFVLLRSFQIPMLKLTPYCGCPHLSRSKFTIPPYHLPYLINNTIYQSIDLPFTIQTSSSTLRSTMSSRICCQSELSWEVRRWQIINKRELSKISNSILTSALLPIELYYFNMNSEKLKIKGLSESRFGSMIFLLRMAGIPFQMKKVSKFYAIYMETVIICFSTTYLGCFADVYMHWDDLGLAMTTMRVLIPFTNMMWIFSYCR